MIYLTVTVESITTLLDAQFDTIQIRRYTGTGTPSYPVLDSVAITDYTTISGTDTINGRTNVSDIYPLQTNYSQYYFTDPDGDENDWYISRYFSSILDATSGWSDPVQGEAGDLYYNPQYPPEVTYGTSDQLVIDRIRLYTGDPINIRREYGEEAISSIHPDGRTYEMDETGWPAFINMGGVPYTSKENPSVNGYRFLRFTEYIDDICTTCSGYVGNCGEEINRDVTNGVDIWYYSFRRSDRQIMEAYESCYPPSPLTTANSNAEVYMVQTSIDLLRGELWEDSTEDGARIVDSETSYDPSPGLEVRRKLLADLIKRRDDLVKALQLTGITGVLLD